MQQPHYSITIAQPQDLSFFYQTSPQLTNEYHIYYKINPRGFLIGRLNGEIISKIFCIKYSKNYAHIGGYYVKEAYRKRGYGLLLWEKVMEFLEGCQFICLGSVKQQVKNYELSGFKVEFQILRRFIKDVPDLDTSRNTIVLKGLKCINLEELIDFDRKYTPHDRSSIIIEIIENGYPFMSIDKVTQDIVGYSCMSKFGSNYLINIMIAINNDVAQDLVKQMFIYYNNLKKETTTLLMINSLRLQEHIEQFLNKWFPNYKDRFWRMILKKDNNDRSDVKISNTYGSYRY